MAKNNFPDFSLTAASNTDVLNQSTAPSTMNANTLDDVLRNYGVILALFYDQLGGVGTVGGTADAITLASNATYPFQSLAAGNVVAFKAGSANTGAATINVDSLGAKAIRKQGDSALAASDIIADGVYLLRYDTAYNSAAGAWILLNPTVNTAVGQQTIWIPAGAMLANTTSGAASGTAETTTNKVMSKTLDFDASSEEFAQFMIQMPKSWNEGTLICQFVWTHPATTTNFGVAWGMEAVAFANDDALDTAWGTEVVTVDTGGTTGDVYISPESTGVTAAGSPGAEEVIALRITRVVANGSDTMAVDAKLIGVKIHYTTDATTDD